MPANDPRRFMWAEAIEMLARAERLHRQMFEPRRHLSQRPGWEPPADVLETDTEVIVISALPGVEPAAVTAVIENGALVIAGERRLPGELQTAHIHRLELPQGHFERRIPLPEGRYDGARSATLNGCLIVRLRKVA
jgi:HSP20 family molecular chaperone IbpA